MVYDPSVISYADLLRLFWENHDPAQGMKQGGDIGSQYRSAIYTQSDSQRVQALASREQYQQAMNENNDSRSITTAIRPLGPFYVAEDYHQQYLEPGRLLRTRRDRCLSATFAEKLAAFPVPVLYCTSAHRQIGCSVRLSFFISDTYALYI